MIKDQVCDEKLGVIDHIINKQGRDRLHGWVKKNAPYNPNHYAVKTADGTFFPIQDPLNILLSWAYFKKYASELDYNSAKEATRKILSNARVYGMNLLDKEQSDDNLSRHLTGSFAIKVAEKYDDLFALEKNGRKLYPLRNEEEVKTAISYFSQNYTRFDPLDRRVYAKKVEKRAEKYTINTGNLIKKYASDSVSDNAEQNINTRLLNVSDEFKEDYKTLSSEFKNLPPKLAMTALYDLDKASGADRCWDKEIDDPISSVFTEVEKRSDEPLLETLYGNVYEADIKEAISQDKLSDLLDQDTSKILSENPKQTLAELPQQLTEVIAQRLAVK